jgi:hypothetical protein
LNEAYITATMGTNPDGGSPQFKLFLDILKNCSTIAEVNEYLKENQPASSHILIAMAEDGGGVFEMLPHDKDKIFDFREADIENGVPVLATNHFVRPEGILKESVAVSCSEERYKKMEEGLRSFIDDPIAIAQSSATNDTVQTFVFKRDINTGELTVEYNTSNYNSAKAIDPATGQINYNKMNITQHHKDFMQTVNRLNQRQGELEMNLSPLDKKLL